MPDDTQMLDVATKYVERYGWSVIPIHAPDEEHDGKRPALGEWLTYSQRKPTLDELGRWFEGERNIGVVCGDVSGGLVVIDCDDMKTYRGLCFAYPDLHHSLTVETGKGRHIYTCLATDVQVRTTSFEVNGSTHHLKAEGSYVVAPPSMHASGRQYKWVDATVPPLMLDLEKLRGAIAKLGGKKVDERASNPPGWAAQLLLDGARDGERDDLTTKLAGHLIHPYPGGLPYDTALAILDLWAEKCDQPWGRHDVEAKLRSVSRKGNQ